VGEPGTLECVAVERGRYRELLDAEIEWIDQRASLRATAIRDRHRLNGLAAEYLDELQWSLSARPDDAEELRRGAETFIGFICELAGVER
jgi:hypothetical protein